MTNNQHRPFRQEQYVNDVEASVEVRAWLEALAASAVPDRERFPTDPSDIPDDELIKQFPRPEVPRRGPELDRLNNILWLRSLEDWRWAHLVRCFIAINGGWPLPPPITWYPWSQVGEEYEEYLEAERAYREGTGPRPVVATLALRRLLRGFEEDATKRRASGAVGDVQREPGRGLSS